MAVVFRVDRAGVVADGPGPGDALVDAVDLGRPRGEPGFGDAVEPEGAGPVRRARRPGVDADDLQVGAGAEVEQGVAGAEARMPPARRRLHPDPPRHPFDGAVDVGGREDEMVDHGAAPASGDGEGAVADDAVGGAGRVGRGAQVEEFDRPVPLPGDDEETAEGDGAAGPLRRHGLGVAGDVGIVDLAGDAGHVIIVAYVKESTKDTPAQEKAIAQVARAAYDYFVFNK